MSFLKKITETEEITPNEAHHIASSLRSQANRVRELATQARGVKSTLDYSWEGNSKNRFSADYDPRINELDNLANELDSKASQIENIRVTITKTRYVIG